MAPIINTSDSRATRILDAAGVDYILVKQGSAGLNPADYLMLETRTGKEGYSGLWVCKYRLSADSDVKEAGRGIGLNNLRNTAQESNGREYVGNINREQAVRLNLALGGRTPNLRIGSDLFKLLLSGKAFDGNGKKVSSQELDSILDEMVGVRSPGRGEWYEDFFTQGKNGLVLNKNYVIEGKNLVPAYSKPVKGGLMEDKTPGIDLASWAKRPTSQGLVRGNTKDGNLSFWNPRANSVVRVDAGSGWAGLYCDRDPLDSDPWLGVRHVREAPQKNK